MKEYISLDGITIQVGENAKDNDELTLNANPKHWWMHASGCPGSHVVICFDGLQLPKETKRDAAVLAIYNSKSQVAKMSHVDLVRVEQITKKPKSTHGLVELGGTISCLTIFMTKEKDRIERLLK